MLQQNAFVSGTGLHRLQRGKSVAGPASEAMAGPHGYPTEKVLNTGNKIGGEVYNSTAKKKGRSNHNDATKRKLEDGWPEA